MGREAELEMMFAEEAAKMWAKQEEVWEREAKARKRLMEEVSDGWKKQHDERLKAAKLVEDEETRRMGEIKEDVRQLSQYIQEQDRRRRQEEIREENKLARHLADWTLDPLEGTT